MKKGVAKLLVNVVLALCLSVGGAACSTPLDSGSSGSSQTPETPAHYQEPALANIKNVILLIGDGMGPNHVKAGEIYKGSQTAIHSMPFSTYSLTRSANKEITDSAAGATALATGVRTNNGYVGVDTDQQTLTTIMDIALERGKRTGVVTTDIMSGATPMAFSAHCEDRHDGSALLSSAAKSGVNLFVSYAEYPAFDDSTLPFEYGGYTKLQDVDDISDETSDYVVGTYSIKATATPQSADLDSVAFDRVVSESIAYLAKDTDGFVLMAEGARIDKQAEKNDFQGMLDEMLAFDNAVQTALDWAKGRNDTIVIVTADHETGGLQLAEDITKENMYSKHSWSTTSHTATNVYCNVYAPSVDFLRYSSEGKATEMKNVDVFTMMKTFVVGYQTVGINVTQNKLLGGEITLDKTEFFYGDTVEITVSAGTNYRLDSFTINGKECISGFDGDGVLSYVIDAREVEMKATFVETTGS